MTVQNARAWLIGRGATVALLLAVAAFCLVGGAPAAATDAGCDGHYASGKVCGQSGPFEPLLGVVPHTPPVQRAGSPAGWLAVRPPSDLVLQSQAAPSSPRAPPLSIH